MIGWIAVGLGCLSALSAAGALAISIAMPSMGSLPTQPGMYFPTWPFEHMRLLATGQIVLAGCAVWTGIAFLRLRSWSRPVMELFAWAALIALLGFSALWTRTALSMSKAMSGQPGMAFPGGMFVAFGLISTLIFVVPNILIIRALRGRAVRAAFGDVGT